MGAFGLALLTGLSLFTVKAGDYADSPLFLTKLTLIAVAVLNFGLFSVIEARVPPGLERPVSLKVMTVLSIGLWLAVLFCGRMLGFV